MPLLASDCEVRTIGGLPTLCIDGQPVPGLLCVAPDPRGRVEVADGELRIVSESLHSGAGIETNAATSDDCTVEVKVAFDSQNGSDASAGITLRRGNGNYVCSLAHYPGGNRLKFWDWNAGGKGLVRFDEPLPWKSGTFYTLCLEVRGARLRAFVDGKLVATGESPAPAAPGPVRLGVYRGRARFRDLAVTGTNGQTVLREAFTGFVRVGQDPHPEVGDGRAGALWPNACGRENWDSPPANGYAFFSLPIIQYKKGAATNIELYVPTSTPTTSAKANA